MAMSSVSKAHHSEGSVAPSIERQTAKLRADLFPRAAIESIVTSAAFQMSGNKDASNLCRTVGTDISHPRAYNKLVEQGRTKTEGHQHATLVGAMVMARAVDDRARSQEILDAGLASVKA